MVTWTNLNWFACIALESALLMRGGVTGAIRKFPLFYVYIACVLAKEIAGVVSYALLPKTYATVYWPTELATIMASFAVLVEIFRRSVRRNPGILRFSQTFLLFAFWLTTVYVCVGFSDGQLRSIYHALAELGSDLRLLEGALLIVLLWLLVRYRISLGRNLAGVIVGYSFWVGVNLTDFAFLYSRGNESSVFLRTLVPASYTITLAIWLLSLWTTRPEPLQPATQLEHDYEFLAAKTRTLLARASGRLARAIKS